MNKAHHGHSKAGRSLLKPITRDCQNGDRAGSERSYDISRTKKSDKVVCGRTLFQQLP